MELFYQHKKITSNIIENDDYTSLIILRGEGKSRIHNLVGGKES